MSTCMEWQMARNRDGYGVGRCPEDKKQKLAHRLAWEAVHGPIPDGLFVLHRCDNPPCVNPDHLFLGTHADNMRDMREKGRSRKCQGEKHPRAKLTESDVLEIRRRVDTGETQTSVARDYGVTISAINNIVLRKRWAHLEEKKWL